MLELRNVRKVYGSSVAVDQINLTIKEGEFFCLLGPSGCGKTTLLRMIAGFERASEGHILLHGEEINDLPPYRRDVNTVFQNYALFPHYSVFDNVAYGLKIKKTPRAEIETRVKESMTLVGLEGYESRRPAQLSGGQQQRVALARALINRPRILLLDEPLSALDKKISEQMRIELAELQRKVGITFIYVTHNQVEAMTMSDRVAVMRGGRIEQCATPAELYQEPKTHFVADFIGSMNFFEGQVMNSTSGECVFNIEGVEARRRGQQSFAAGDRIMFGLRPEQIKLSLLEPKDYENALPGVIEHRIYMGEVTKFIVRLDSGRRVEANVMNYLVVESMPMPFEMGERVFITWSQGSGILLHA